jgi:hypothetical protein
MLVRTTAIGAETTLARIVRMVEHGPGQKSADTAAGGSGQRRIRAGGHGACLGDAAGLGPG